MVFVKTAAVVAVSLQIAAAAAADEIESHPAHEHGKASLNIGVEAGRVELEFDSPAINVIGFEHAPRTETEKAAASRAQRTLQDAGRLFVASPAAECRTTSAEVTVPTWAEGETHADYEARYALQCAKPQLLQSIEVRLVDALVPDTKLHVQVVSGGKQSSTELTRGKSLVAIR